MQDSPLHLHQWWPLSLTEMFLHISLRCFVDPGNVLLQLHSLHLTSPWYWAEALEQLQQWDIRNLGCGQMNLSLGLYFLSPTQETTLTFSCEIFGVQLITVLLEGVVWLPSYLKFLLPCSFWPCNVVFNKSFTTLRIKDRLIGCHFKFMLF